jgi:hypothetical protein
MRTMSVNCCIAHRALSGQPGRSMRAAVGRHERRFGSIADLDVACAQTQKTPWQACQGVGDRTLNNYRVGSSGAKQAFNAVSSLAQTRRQRKNPPIRRSGGSSVRLLLFLRRRLRPSSCAPGIPSFLQLGHLERPSRPQLAARRHGLESQSRHPEPGHRPHSSCRSRRNTSPDRSQFAFRRACTAATKPCDHAIRRLSRPSDRAVF